jgi:hypothetical protein
MMTAQKIFSGSEMSFRLESVIRQITKMMNQEAMIINRVFSRIELCILFSN